ncbi:MAG: elongation factor G [Chlorobiaceae bacterium]|mgnify:CR=1 FL=1|nr:elongation factor G [Chlorobiaceae bacterium]MBA4310002.1 elongation factor G [Chlorobiaceae bacterium]
MKEYSPESIRNVALIGHGGTGKTTLTEILLFTAGETTRVGKVGEGNTVSDYTSNEVERQFSISLSSLHLDWQNTKLNLLDTPGYTDFIGEVKCGLKVSDTAIMLLRAVEGVEVGSETTLRLVNELGLPLAFVVNKIDNEHSNFKEVVKKAKERLTTGAVVVTFPATEGLQFNTVVDVVKMKAFQYGPIGSKKVTEMEIPENCKADAEAYRTELIEKVAELDEALMSKYFDEGSLSDKELEIGIKKSMINRSLSPVFAMSADKGVGMNNFLDFVVKYFPAPSEGKIAEGSLKDSKQKVQIPCKPNAEPVIFIFKTVAEQHVGELSLFKVFSGRVNAGMDLINENTGKVERLNQISILNGRHRKEVTSLSAGDIGAVVKLKDTHTNNTLASKTFAVVLEPIVFPSALLKGAIIPHSKGDEDKIANCLHSLHEEDPSFNVKFDPEISQTIISGQGELHLALAIKRLKERYNVSVDLVEPKIPYKETIKGKAESIEYKHKKQSGGRGQYGHIFLKIEPQPRGKGFEFVDAVVGGNVPGRFIPAVEKGVIETMERGILSGCKVVDVKVTIFDGSHHPVDSDDMSFKIAGSMGFKKGFLEARPILLEPIYDLVVKIPDDCMGDVMGDLSSRRGKILGMDSDGHFQIIKAQIPLSEIYKYSSTLRSLTAGRGAYSTKFRHYEEVPKEVEAKVVEEYKKSKLEE